MKKLNVLLLFLAGIVLSVTAIADEIKLTTVMPSGAGIWKKAQAPSNDIYYDQGKVGIGTAGSGWPASQLDIKSPGGAADGQGLRLTNSASGRSWELKSGSPAVNNNYFTLKDITAAAVRMTITDTGNVGIGTATPLATQDSRIIKLDVAENIVAKDVYLDNPKTGNARWVSEPSFSFHHFPSPLILFGRGNGFGSNDDNDTWVPLNMPISIPASAKGVMFRFLTVADERTVKILFRSSLADTRLASYSYAANNSDDAASDVNSMILPYTATFEIRWSSLLNNLPNPEPNSGAMVMIDGYIE